MNANERRACEGTLSDDAPIAESIEWIRQHVERLTWELESTARTLTEATAMMRKKEGEQ